MKTNIKNRLAEIRKSRGVGASDLARRVNVSRQTIYAIEAGTYVPNTEVALNLARELEVTVDELFSLGEDDSETAGSLAADVLSGSPAEKGQPVRVCQIGSRWVERARQRLALLHAGSRRHHPAHRAGKPPRRPGGVREGRSGPETAGAGRVRSRHRSSCAHGGKDQRRRDRLRGSFQQAGADLAQGREGAHRRLASGRSEDRRIQPALSSQENFRTRISASHVRALGRRTGRRPGKSESLRKIEDLARKNVRFVNREPGSGSRALLDRLLGSAGHRRRQSRRAMTGWRTVTWRPLTACMSGEADVCLATRSAAQTFGLDFVPLHSERYDLVMRKKTAVLPRSDVPRCSAARDSAAEAGSSGGLRHVPDRRAVA